MKAKHETDNFCPKCGHHMLVHDPVEGCQVRTLVEGYPDFASLPKCGCMPEAEVEQ